MLYIDVGNTLRGGLRTGIQRVVRSLSYELAVNSGVETRLIAFDVGTGRYFALADPVLIRSADGLGDIGREARAYFDFDAFAKGDIFFEPDSSWTEPLNRGALFRRLKAKGVIVVVLNHDAVPILLPEVCHPNALVSFAETIADHIQYADYALATSARVARDLCAVAERFLGRSMSTRVIKLGADFAAPPSGAGEDEPGATQLPELSGLRYLLSVGTIEPRKNHALLLQAFDRLSAKDAGLVIVGRKGRMADETLGTVVGSVSFKPLGPHTLQLTQMAVAESAAGRRRGIAAARFCRGLGAARRLWHDHPQRPYRRGGFLQEAWLCGIEGEPFDENTIPHIRMTKRTLGGKRMSLEVGDKAPSFTSAGRWRRQGRAQGPQGQEGRALFLSKGRHLWLHGGGLRLPRQSPRLLQGEGGDRRHLARLGGRATTSSRRNTSSPSRSSPMKTAKCARPTAPG